MKLSKSTWHYKVYLWWLLHKAKNTWRSINRPQKDDDGIITSHLKVLLKDATADELLPVAKYMTQHNLCLYIRVVLFYALGRYIFYNPLPRIILANILLFSLNIYMLLNLDGVFMYRFMIDFTQGLIRLIIVVIVLCSIAGTVYLTVMLCRKGLNKGSDTDFYVSVVKPYMKGAKEKVCHIIEFN